MAKAIKVGDEVRCKGGGVLRPFAGRVEKIDGHGINVVCHVRLADGGLRMARDYSLEAA